MDKPSVVTITKAADRQLDRVPKHIREEVYVWVAAVEESGIRNVRRCPGYHDEPLKGDRDGQRSVRLSRSYRLIYQELEGERHIQILVLEVSKHDY